MFKIFLSSEIHSDGSSIVLRVYFTCLIFRSNFYGCFWVVDEVWVGFEKLNFLIEPFPDLFPWGRAAKVEPILYLTWAYWFGVLVLVTDYFFCLVLPIPKNPVKSTFPLLATGS